MIGLNGVLAFSRYPLHLIPVLGIILSGLSFLHAIVYPAMKLAGFAFPTGQPDARDRDRGLRRHQLLSLGVMGE